MGRQSPYQFVILVLLLGFSIFPSCVIIPRRYDPSVAAFTLTGISWTENTIEISYIRYGERKIKDFFFIGYKNFPGGIYLEASNVEEEYYYGYTGTIIADLTDVPISALEDVEMTYNDRGWLIYKPTLVINEDAIIIIEEEGNSTGGVRAEVFIGEDRIDILSQRFYYHRWYY
jgi:hypothetical protein